MLCFFICSVPQLVLQTDTIPLIPFFIRHVLFICQNYNIIICARNLLFATSQLWEPLRNILWLQGKVLTQLLKENIYAVAVLSVLLYSSETWIVAQTQWEKVRCNSETNNGRLIRAKPLAIKAKYSTNKGL